MVGLCVRDKEIKYGRGMLIYSSCVLLESIYATELCYLDGNGVVYRVLWGGVVGLQVQAGRDSLGKCIGNR